MKTNESTTETAGAKPVIRAVEHTPGQVESLSDRIIHLWFSGSDYTNLKNLADAAPDLLAACKLLREWIGGPGQTSHPLVYDSLREEAWEKSSAAIRKAEEAQ